VRPRTTWDVVCWGVILAVYLWAGILCARNVRYSHHLENMAVIQDSIIRGQRSLIDSLEALLYIQEVDMVGFKTLCYIKTLPD